MSNPTTSSTKSDEKDVGELRKKAKALLKKSPDNLCMRSCWNCNAAHEHLKKADYVIVCVWGCGHYYYKGVDITEPDVLTNNKNGGEDE